MTQRKKLLLKNYKAVEVTKGKKVLGYIVLKKDKRKKSGYRIHHWTAFRKKDLPELRKRVKKIMKW